MKNDCVDVTERPSSRTISEDRLESSRGRTQLPAFCNCPCILSSVCETRDDSHGTTSYLFLDHRVLRIGILTHKVNRVLKGAAIFNLDFIFTYQIVNPFG